jgi:predicted nuclease with TOPRIM domain
MTEFAWNAAEGQEAEPAKEHQEHSGEAGIVTLSVGDFSALEERVLRTVEVVRRERQARTAAEERATRVEAELQEQSALIEQTEKELSALRAERDQVRQRVERLLGQLDALEL